MHSVFTGGGKLFKEGRIGESVADDPNFNLSISFLAADLNNISGSVEVDRCSVKEL